MKYFTNTKIFFSLIVLLLLFDVYLAINLSSEKETTALLTEIENGLKKDLASSTQEIINLNTKLTSVLNENKDISRDLRKEENKNDKFEDQIKAISGTVGTLDKLSKIDPEVLQKYSKIYFLNEHYTPPQLVQMKDRYVSSEIELEFIHKDVRNFFEDMLDDALDDDIEIWVVSAYRSFDEQADLKSSYAITYGEGANTFSADQGYSEHQLGTTFDFTTTNLGGGLSGFQNTEAYTWLIKNAHKYGFVLSYPEENDYYIFEPWHWRFVGTDLADDLHDDKETFYNLDQRDIDEYLISIFD